MSHTKGQSLIIPVDTAVSTCGEVVFLSSKMPSPSQCDDEYDQYHSVVEQCSGWLHFAEENIGSCQAPPLPVGGGGAVGGGGRGIRRGRGFCLEAEGSLHDLHLYTAVITGHSNQ